MLHLDKDLLIATGDNRHVFFHPENNDLCVKVLKNNIHPKVQNREISYHDSLARRKISWEHLAQYHGSVETDQGTGVVFSLVKDSGGNISNTLHHYLKNESELTKELGLRIEELKKYLFDEAIVFRDLITLNIVVQYIEDNKPNLVIIDGIGHNDVIPFVNYSKYMARKKIVRQWNRKMEKWFFEYPGLSEIIKLFDN